MFAAQFLTVLLNTQTNLAREKHKINSVSNFRFLFYLLEKEAYDSMTEQKANTILENFSLSEIDFNELKFNIVNLVSRNSPFL